MRGRPPPKFRARRSNRQGACGVPSLPVGGIGVAGLDRSAGIDPSGQPQRGHSLARRLALPFVLRSARTESCHLMRKLRSLVITPFDAAGRRVHDTVERALLDLNVELARLENVAGAPLTNVIIDFIRSSDFLVVDITRQNPNVFYELGFAHAMNKPTILIASTETTGEIPADLSGIQIFVYDPSNLRELGSYLRRAVQPLVSEAASRYE